MASSWLGGLKNIQDQLTDFTKEVLNETVEDVEDSDTALQVARKQLASFEVALEKSRGEVESLNEQLQDYVERTGAADLQIQALHHEHKATVQQKDNLILQLKSQLSDQTHKDAGHSALFDAGAGAADSPPLSPSQDFELTQLRADVVHLKSEVQHWKALVRSADTDVQLHEKCSSLEQRVQCMVEQHQDDVAALQQSHYEATKELRLEYEQRIAALQMEYSQTLGADPPWRRRNQPPMLGHGDRCPSVKSESGSASNVQSVSVSRAATSRLSSTELGEVDSEQEQSEWDNDGWTNTDFVLDKTTDSENTCSDSYHTSTQITLTQQLESSLEKNERLREQLDELRKQMQQLTATPTPDQTPDTDSADKDRHIESLQTEIDGLNQSIEQLDSQHELVVQKLLSDKKALSDDLESSGAEFAQLRIELAVAVAAQKELSDAHEAEAARLKQHVANAEHWQQQCELLQTQLEEARKSESVAADRLKANETELSEQKTSLNELQLQVNTYEAQWTAQVATNAQLNITANEELQRLRLELVESKQENARLQEKIDQTQALTSKQQQAEAEQQQVLDVEGVQSAVPAHELQSQLNELHAYLQRYRTVVGEEAAKIVEMQVTAASVGSSGSSSSAAEDSHWDKLSELPELSVRVAVQQSEASTSTQSHSLTQSPSTTDHADSSSMQLQLREALAALTEKTEECEAVHNQLTLKRHELDEREELLQQAFTELKGLESQLAEGREREKSMKNNVQRLTIDSGRQDAELSALRNELAMQADREQELMLYRDHLQLQGELDNLLQAASTNTATETESNTTQTDYNENENSELQQQMAQAMAQCAQLQQALTDTQTQLDQSTQEQSDMKALIQQMQTHTEHLNTVQTERDQLVVLVNEKHQEAVDYHEQVQSLTQQLHLLQQNSAEQTQTHTQLVTHLQSENARLVHNNEQHNESEHELAKLVLELSTSRDSERALKEECVQLAARVHELSSKQEDQSVTQHALTQAQLKCTKLEQDVQRLTQHLVQLEDTYTAEALAAEDTQTDLLNKLRLAEQNRAQTTQSLHTDNTQLQERVEDLSRELAVLAESRDSAVMQVASLKQEKQTVESALHRLQTVVSDMQHELDTHSTQHTTHATALCTSLRAQLKNSEEQKEASEQKLTLVTQQQLDTAKQLQQTNSKLTQAMSEIEHLQTQLTQLTHNNNTNQQYVDKTKVVDKELLRNLLLGYFTAPEDKKHDVSLLLASILAFSNEDIRKMSGGQQKGWLSLLGGSGSGTDQSITEQFVHFMQNESERKNLAQTQPLAFDQTRNESASPKPSPSTALSFELPSFTNTTAEAVATSDFLREALLD